MLVSSKNQSLSIGFREEVCIDMQRQASRLLSWQEGVEQSLCKWLRIDPQANADLGTSTKVLKLRVCGIQPRCRISRISPQDMPMLYFTTRAKTSGQSRPIRAI
ncbi:hypothetical protein D3C76_1181770 [compost metagenome]